MNTENLVPQAPIFISEVFPLDVQDLNYAGFRITPETFTQSQDVANRLCYHLSRQFPNIVVAWESGTFIVLGQIGKTLPTLDEWRVALNRVQAEVEDFSQVTFSLQGVRQPPLTPTLLGKLASQILNNVRFAQRLVCEQERLRIVREVEIWPEQIELTGILTAALCLTVKTRMLCRGTLADFLNTHPERHNSDTLLMGLQVKALDRYSSGTGTIQQLSGHIGDKKAELLKWATGAISQRALEEAPDDQPIVGVQFGKNRRLYDYALAALCPVITEGTAERFGVEYGELLKHTKIPLPDRQNYLQASREQATQALNVYGIQLGKSVNSQTYPSQFWYPEADILATQLQFGNNRIYPANQVLQGLRSGGVYRQEDKYKNNPIIIAALKLCDFVPPNFIKEVEDRLKRYGFQTKVLKQSLSPHPDPSQTKVALEKKLTEIAGLMPDIILILLPTTDRQTDGTEHGSLYGYAYQLLLRSQIASQFIYEDTLKTVKPEYILNHVIPGILAKLGNQPFILANPLPIADYFIGLDVARQTKVNAPGTLNACASVRLYGARGEFIRYQISDGFTEGEEIPKRILEQILPATGLEQKTIGIYRDGRFCGREVENLLERATAIGTRLVLIECIKSGSPRLYHCIQNSASNHWSLEFPRPGLAFKLSAREAILVTTKPSQQVGLARPLRLRVHEASPQVLLDDVLETTLKLTLLHHGSLNRPRLPVLLHGADRMAGLKLKGILPTILDGNRQFWL